MKQFRTVKLGTVCEDRATHELGTITHCIIDLDQRIDYIFQPRGCNPEDGQPVKRTYIELTRLAQLNDDDFELIDVPIEILGSDATDKASTFSGMAVAFVRHLNGCFHVRIQPPGRVPKTNSFIAACEFDLRGCSGPNIPVLSEAAKAESQRQTPSPIEDLPSRHLPE